jgi:hypothetical protein
MTTQALNATLGAPVAPVTTRAFSVLKVAHAETVNRGGLTPKAAWDTLGAFAERIGAPFPTNYRERVLDAASVSAVKQRGATRSGSVKLVDAWKEAIRHSEQDGGKDEGMRDARTNFTLVARLHAAFGSTEE